METAAIAKVAVAAAPYSIDKPYDYLIPAPLQADVCPGVRVTVPFGRGNRSSEGIVLACETGKKTPELKAIDTVLDSEPVLGAADLSLALFLRQRYFCTLYEAARVILPAGLWYRFHEIYQIKTDREQAYQTAESIKGAVGVLDFLFANGGRGELNQLREACGETVQATLKALCSAEILSAETEAQRKVSDKTVRIVTLAVSAEDALAEADRKKGKAPMRSEVLRLLASIGSAASADLCYFTGASPTTLRALQKAGFVTFEEAEALRVPDVEPTLSPPPIVLNAEQQTAYDTILALIQKQESAAALLQGVTGSGKTQVYIRLVQEVLAQGKNAMVLVPEIILTPQMMQKFASYFGSQVVMLHSSLRLTERYDQWKRIRRGDVRVVLGTRSAIFSPLRNLGIIILDEEQESSYQSEQTPRYHTRDVAKYRCAQDHCVLLLGSATPAVETAWNARSGIYHYTELRQRYNEHALPQVYITDMRKEIRSGNAGSVSARLREELQHNLDRGEQSILFLNRRGNSRMLVCGECGSTPECPRCSVPLTYHSANGRLMCHYCGHSQRAAESCPVCGGKIKHVGIGTQKVEEELLQLFPDVPILRMDADTTATGHEPILRKFSSEKIPILLGTQMVAKGLDFENVTLVGVLSADLSLYVDHYRAAERTFSLLTQVVGRAGRGEKTGRAVIQTYTPGNAVICSAAQQDYEQFYNSEIAVRKIRRYPPFADLFTFCVSGTDEGLVLKGAAWLREELRRLAAAPEMQASQPEVLGPAPAPVVKVNNRFRYRVTLVGKNDRETRQRISWLLKVFASQREHRGLSAFVDCNILE